MFDKILIANRNEIACRVMATAKRLGIATVAVYSEADAGARHVEMADEAILIGPPAARESYLVAEAILGAAAKSGAQAIHPGYGFLSENADFADAVAAQGLVFIGPPADAIREMGEKAAAKALMEQAGVPVVPGYHGADQDDALLAQEAEAIGYPVLIKAVAGGGGKGMRQVGAPGDFEKALAGARREASSAFGDDKVLIEKYLQHPRHIEIQVFADSHGNVVHLFERDCSIQRRHQKVLEEAPAPGMSAEMRRAMGDAAVAAAKSIGYLGAGTVEFIADVQEGLRADRFFFMEMNTRLQVEHPVTEMVTGQDLVEWQLRVAAGEALPLSQDELALSGHAIEARIYAENPAKKFFPSTGRLTRFRPPQESAHVRVDTGVREGDEVTVHYDPMIAKLVVWERDRARALQRMRGALAAYQIAGVMNNVDFLSAVAAHPAFVAGDVETGFIERYAGDLLAAPGVAPDKVLAIASLDILLRRAAAFGGAAARTADPHSPWAVADGWRLNDTGHDELIFESGGEEVTVAVHYAASGRYELELPGGTLGAGGELDEAGNLAADFDGARSAAAVVHDGDALTVFIDGHTWRLSIKDPMAHADVDLDVGGDVAAPLPGKIAQVVCKAGDKVKKGAALLILEAMKMEHTITAPADAIVKEVLFAAGDQVDEGALLVAFEDADD